MTEIQAIDIVYTSIGRFGMCNIGGIPNYNLCKKGRVAIKFQPFSKIDLTYLRTLAKASPNLTIEDFKDSSYGIEIPAGDIGRFLNPDFIEQTRSGIEEKIRGLEKKVNLTNTCENQITPELVQNNLLFSMFLQYVRQHGRNFLDLSEEIGVNQISFPEMSDRILVFTTLTGMGNSGHGPYKILVYDIKGATTLQGDIVTRPQGSHDKNLILGVETWDLERRNTLTGTGVYAFREALEKLKVK